MPNRARRTFWHNRFEPKMARKSYFWCQIVPNEHFGIIDFCPILDGRICPYAPKTFLIILRHPKKIWFNLNLQILSTSQSYHYRKYIGTKQHFKIFSCVWIFWHGGISLNDLRSQPQNTFWHLAHLRCARHLNSDKGLCACL